MPKPDLGNKSFNVTPTLTCYPFAITVAPNNQNRKERETITMMAISFINNNLPAQQALRNLTLNTKRNSQAARQLASGLKVEQSSDDASGFAVSKYFTRDILTNARADQNIQDGLSLLEVSDGALGSITESLQRARELTVQLASDVYGPPQKAVIGQELRVSTSQFNGIALLDGTTTEAKVQIAGNSNVTANTIDIAPALVASDSVALKIYGTTYAAPPRWSALTLDDIYSSGTTQINTSERALLFLGDIDNALQQVNVQRGTVGALANQLTRTGDFVGIKNTTLQQARSGLIDADIAKVSADYTQTQVLRNAGVSILSQANTSYQQVLELLRQN
jgi:flagellin